MDRIAIEEESLEKDINNIAIMSYIGVKGIIRKWREPDFTNFIKDIYKQIEDLTGNKTEKLPEKLSFELIYKEVKTLYS